MSKQVKTKKGYDLFEVVSALQKTIRRGEEADALYWAMEMHNSGFHAYMWKRLITISMEDVAAANPQIVPQVRACKENYYDMDKSLLALTCAVHFMCRSPKSRYTDWSLCIDLETHNARNLKIPDYALDKHTRRGKMMKRGKEHFVSEGTKLHPYAPLDGEEELKQQWLKLATKERDVTHDELGEDHPDYQPSNEPRQDELNLPTESAPRQRRRKVGKSDDTSSFVY